MRGGIFFYYQIRSSHFVQKGICKSQRTQEGMSKTLVFKNGVTFLMYLKAGCDCKATSTSEFFLLKKFDMEDVLPNSKIIEFVLCCHFHIAT